MLVADCSGIGVSVESNDDALSSIIICSYSFAAFSSSSLCFALDPLSNVESSNINRLNEFVNLGLSEFLFKLCLFAF